MNKISEMIQTSKYDLFPGERADNPYLKMFLEYVETENPTGLEYSCKFTGDQYTASRVNISYRGEYSDRAEKCVEFFRERGVDLSELMSVNKQFYSETLFGFVFGIEIADQVHFKNHLMIQQSDTAVKSILNTKGVNPEVKKWIDKTDLLDIALGIVPGEAVQYRTYIGFAHPLAAKDLLIKKLGKVGEAMSMCHNTGLAWKDETTSDPYIYLERPDLRPVFSLLKLKIEHDRLVRYGRDPYIFGTVLSDLKARKLKGFNTYYQMK